MIGMIGAYITAAFIVIGLIASYVVKKLKHPVHLKNGDNKKDNTG